MKTLIAIATGAALSACACSSSPFHANTGSASGQNTAGPTVVSVRPEPGVVELNRDFQPMRPAEVLADIKDRDSRISNVVLQFAGIPLEVPMENIGGNTWRAQLMPRQLEMLAVNGQTIHYEAQVVARDTQGQTGSSKVPVQLAIKTPDIIGKASGSATGTGTG